MAQEPIMLNNYSDDSKIKEYISNVLAPRVFHDIPLNVLNLGYMSIVNEYMSQALEQLAYTGSFYFNESFITKSVLPDSIYAEAAIFNIGYSFATPSSCNFLLELKIEDIYKNAVLNADNGLYEFILDKDTKFNLSNGSVYSLDYDILIQYKNEETSSRATAAIPMWNVQYTNKDVMNSIATNKGDYIVHRVTDNWLCLLVTASEYSRETHVVVNNTSNGIANADTVITVIDHLAGFDIKYIDGTSEKYIPHDHILPIHSKVEDDQPYVHYIMDSPQTIRFMWQLNGNKHFVPPTNSSFEITLYTCHGEAANCTSVKDEQPLVISASNKYSNNGNILKAAFMISGSLGGTNIGNAATVRRETIEAYNTANVLSTDHDIDEYFKTFYFKNILYPFFFKRRDDPWGRIWSGYIALKDDDDYVFRTNTLHGWIDYDVLYSNNDNTVSANEIIIPPGWVWTYKNADENRFTVVPYTKSDSKTIESADTQTTIDERFVFANPFGIRIQKDPFAIGYFNLWINEYATASKIRSIDIKMNNKLDTGTDSSIIYHATPILINIKRTFKDNYYRLTTFINPTIERWIDGSNLVKYVRQNVSEPTFAVAMWNYFKKPTDMFASDIPLLVLSESDGYLPFDPEKTYFCVKTRDRYDESRWSLSNMWILDNSTSESQTISIPVMGGGITGFIGDDSIWGDEGLWEPVYVSGDTTINLYKDNDDKWTNSVEFNRVPSHNYYEMRFDEDYGTDKGYGVTITKMIVEFAAETQLTKYSESNLWRIGKKYEQNIYVNMYGDNDELVVRYTINNASDVFCPYPFTKTTNNGVISYVCDLANVGAGGIILYADMKPQPSAGAIDYYRIKFSKLAKNSPMFHIENELLPMNKNNMRVLLFASLNGVETGHVEMQPISVESDGSFRFESNMYPLNAMVDVDNRINIASIENGGGSWIPTSSGSAVTIDATTPEFKIVILIRSEDDTRESEIKVGDEYTGFRIVDEYSIDNLSLVQELKEMRSVVNFGDSSVPTENEQKIYDEFMNLCKYDPNKQNLYTIDRYAHSKVNGIDPKNPTYSEIKNIASVCLTDIESYIEEYVEYVSTDTTPFDSVKSVLKSIIENPVDKVKWLNVYNTLETYPTNITENAFTGINVTGGMEIQLVPFVEYGLMMNDRFESFVASFTQVHKALEPVIMQRLEGNNYLDCKLIATYGLPHTYCSDLDLERATSSTDVIEFWPNLDVQVEFDVKLKNMSLSTNTINELRTVIKDYFNRLTSVHTAVDVTSMDNNIYISHVIQKMEENDNVAYLRFRGWYTNEKGLGDSNYMDANYQSIVQRWSKLEDFPKKELERFVPELFLLEDDNIVINILQ